MTLHCHARCMVWYTSTRAVHTGHCPADQIESRSYCPYGYTLHTNREQYTLPTSRVSITVHLKHAHWAIRVTEIAMIYLYVTIYRTRWAKSGWTARHSI